MDRCCCLDNYVMSQWICEVAIDNKHHVTNRLDLSNKVLENMDHFHRIQVIRKCVYFTSKTESSPTSQDNMYICSLRFGLDIRWLPIFHNDMTKYRMHINMSLLVYVIEKNIFVEYMAKVVLKSI